MRKILFLIAVGLLMASTLPQPVVPTEKKWFGDLGIQQGLYLPGDRIVKDLSRALTLENLSSVNPVGCPGLSYVPPHDPKTDITLPYSFQSKDKSCRSFTQTLDSKIHIGLCGDNELVIIEPFYFMPEQAITSSVKVSDKNPGSTNCFSVVGVKNQNLVFVACTGSSNSSSFIEISSYKIVLETTTKHSLQYLDSTRVGSLDTSTSAKDYVLYTYELLNLGPDDLFSYSVYLGYTNPLADDPSPVNVLYNIKYMAHKFFGSLQEVDTSKIKNFPDQEDVLAIQGDSEFMYVFNDATEDIQVSICYMSSLPRAFCGKPIAVRSVLETDEFNIRVSKTYRSSEISILITSSEEINRLIYTFDTSTNDLSLKLIGTPFVYLFDSSLSFLKDIDQGYDMGSSLVIKGRDSDKKTRLVRVWIETQNFIEISLVKESTQTAPQFLITRDPKIKNQLVISVFGLNEFTLFKSGPPRIQIAAQKAADGTKCQLIALYKDSSTESLPISYTVLADINDRINVSVNSEAVGYQGIDLSVPVSSSSFMGNNPSFELKEVKSGDVDNLKASVHYNDVYRVNKDYPTLLQRQKSEDLKASNLVGKSTSMIHVGDNYFLEVRSNIVRLQYIQDSFTPSSEHVSLFEIYSFPTSQISSQKNGITLRAASFSQGVLYTIFDIRDQDKQEDEDHQASSAIVTLNITNLEEQVLKIGYSKNSADSADILIEDGQVRFISLIESLRNIQVSYLSVPIDIQVDAYPLTFQRSYISITDGILCPVSVQFGPVTSRSLFIHSHCINPKNIHSLPIDIIYRLRFTDSLGFLDITDSYPLRGYNRGGFCLTNTHIHFLSFTPVKSETEIEVEGHSLDSYDSSVYRYPILDLMSQAKPQQIICDRNADMFHILVESGPVNNTSRYVVSMRGNASSGGNRRVHSVNKVEDTRDIIAAGYYVDQDMTMLLASNSQVDDNPTAIVLHVSAPLVLVQSNKLNLKNASETLKATLVMTNNNGSKTHSSLFLGMVIKYDGSPDINLRRDANAASLIPTKVGTEEGSINLEQFLNITGSVRRIELESSSSDLYTNTIVQRLTLEQSTRVKTLSPVHGVVSTKTNQMFYYGKGYVAFKSGSQTEKVLKIDGDQVTVVHAQILQMKNLFLPVLVYTTIDQTDSNRVNIMYSPTGKVKDYTTTQSETSIVRGTGDVLAARFEDSADDSFLLKAYTNVGGSRLITYIFDFNVNENTLILHTQPRVQKYDEKIQSITLSTIGTDLFITSILFEDESDFYFTLDYINIKINDKDETVIVVSEISQQRSDLQNDERSIPAIDHSRAKLGCSVISNKKDSPTLGCTLIGSDVYSVHRVIQFGNLTAISSGQNNTLLAEKHLVSSHSLKNIPGFIPKSVQVVKDYALVYHRAVNFSPVSDSVNDYPNPLTENELFTIYKTGGDIENQQPFAIVSGSTLREQFSSLSDIAIGLRGALVYQNDVPQFLVVKPKSDQIEQFSLQDFTLVYKTYKTIVLSEDLFLTESYTSSESPLEEISIKNFFLNNYTPQFNHEKSRVSHEIERNQAEEFRVQNENQRVEGDKMRTTQFKLYQPIIQDFDSKANKLMIDINQDQLFNRVSREFEGKIRSINKKSDDLVSSTQNLTQTTIDGQNIPLKQQLTILETKSDKNSQILSQMQTSVVSYIKTAKSLIANLQEKSSNFDDSDDKLSTKVDNLSGQINDFINDIQKVIKDSIQRGLESVSTKQSSNNVAIASLNTTLTQLTQSQQDLQQKFEDFQKDNDPAINTIKTQVQDDKIQIQKLVGNVNNINNQIESTVSEQVATDVKPILDNINQVESSRQALGKEFDQSFKQYSEIYEETEGKIKNFNDQVSNFTKNGEENNKKTEAVVNAYKDKTEKRFTDVKTKIDEGNSASGQFSTLITVLFITLGVLAIFLLVIIGVIVYMFMQVRGLKNARVVGVDGMRGDGVATESDYSRLQAVQGGSQFYSGQLEGRTVMDCC